MSDTTTTVEVTKEAQGRLVISSSAPSPLWATWVFRIQFILNKMFLVVAGGTKMIPPHHLQEAILWAAAVDIGVWSLAKMLGIEKPQIDTDKP